MELKHFIPLWHAVINAHKPFKTCWCCPTFHSYLTIGTIAAVSFGIGLVEWLLWLKQKIGGRRWRFHHLYVLFEVLLHIHFLMSQDAIWSQDGKRYDLFLVFSSWVMRTLNSVFIFRSINSYLRKKSCNWMAPEGKNKIYSASFSLMWNLDIWLQ